jgi:porin
MAAELRLPTNFFGMPGHQLFGATWSNRGYVSFDQDPRLLFGALVTRDQALLQRKSDSWSAYYNFDQYLYVDPCNPARGWGIFGRFGVSDANPNPLEWFLSFGVGGNSMLRGREQDTFGIGYYFAASSDEINVLRGVGDGQGVELFYNIAVTPYLHITPDLQVLVPASNRFDTAIVAGIRAQIAF